MNKTRFTLKACAFLVFTLACASAAHAQATRTWVSGVGDDVNPCSRTAPCKTFAGAISKTADNGEIDVLDPGGFGALTITKGITVDGGGFVAGVLNNASSGIVVNAPNTKSVTIRNVTLEGVGTGTNGIRILSARDVHIENCSIYGFANHGIDIAQATATQLQVVVANTIIRDCAQNAVNMSNTSTGEVDVTINNSRLERCANGLVTSAHSRVLVSFTEMTHNATAGITVSNADAIVNAESAQIVYSTSGIVASGGADRKVRMARCLVTQNATGLNISGGAAVESAGNNFIFGNGTDGSPTATPGQK
jgi:hypothetical protein